MGWVDRAVFRGLLGMLLLGVGLSCRTTRPAPAKPVAKAPPAPMPAGLDESALDPSVSPCDDFFRYACGGWLDHTTIPADRPSWSRSFSVISERNEQLLNELLGVIASGHAPPDTAYAQKLGDYYASCMDEPKLEQALPTLQAELQPFEKLHSARDAALAVARMHRDDLPVLFELHSLPDFKDARQMIADADQGGLSLPDRDYYLKDDPKTAAVRQALRTYAKNLFLLLGKPEAAANDSADRVLAFETQLARGSMDKVLRRDPLKLLHRIDRKGLKALAPRFPWDAYFAMEGLPDQQALNVSSPDFFRALNQRMKDTPLPTWSAYLTFHFTNAVVAALPGRFQAERFKMRRALTGAAEDLPRWKKCVAYEDRDLGEAVGRIFVARTFGAQGKTETKALVDRIEAALNQDFDAIDWMDAPTRAQARVKLQGIANQIGYPDHWRNYDSLTIDRSSYLENVLRAGAFERARDSKKIGQPVDRSDWYTTPATVNAYYEPTLNEITFPAGILQPPFFSATAGRAVNLGAMGMVVGHEVTHGFDDEGRHYDQVGTMRDWWTAASDQAFRSRAACVKDQFDHQAVLGDMHLNGALELGENVADLGGLKLSHAALMADLAQHPQPTGLRYTPDQQFFLGYAQIWCTKYRDPYLRMLVSTDPHAPARERVNLPLSNLPSFRDAFQCKAGDKMVSAHPCAVW